MRGYPLLNTILVIVLLALARGPLYRSIAVGDSIDHEHIVGENTAEDEASAPAILKIVGTSPLVKIHVEYMGKVIVEKGGDSSFEEPLPGLTLPPGGIEFWVEAKFADKDQWVALSFEIETDTGDVWKRTLWGKDGVIADAVVLLNR